jgi:hypothetical protein
MKRDRTLSQPKSQSKPSSSKQPAALSSITERLATIANLTPSQSQYTPHQTERRRQIRGLLLLAFAVLAFSVLHAGIHNVFHPGWWHPW